MSAPEFVTLPYEIMDRLQKLLAVNAVYPYPTYQKRLAEIHDEIAPFMKFEHAPPPPGFARYAPDLASQTFHAATIKRAEGVLTPGNIYRVTGGKIGTWSSSLELEDTAGEWDSALFECDIGKCNLRKMYLHMKP